MNSFIIPLSRKRKPLQTYNNIKEYVSNQPSVVTIGTFDGLHQGHQKILNRVREKAAENNLTSIVLTFFPHPRMVLQPDHDLKLINTIDERVDQIQQQGIDHVIIHPFSKDFSRTTATEYVEDILVEQLKAKVVVIGYDHRFGRNRSANIDELRVFSKKHNFQIIEISKKEVEEVAVSSTKIRKAINEGAVDVASQYLDRSFSIEGRIVRGKQLGRTIDYPTANLEVVENYKIIPASGVYVTCALIDGKTVYGMTNIGVNPTVSDGNPETIETYFFDFDQDLYDQRLRLFFHKRLRAEKQFGNMEQLKIAMQTDEKQAREYVQQMG